MAQRNKGAKWAALQKWLGYTGIREAEGWEGPALWSRSVKQEEACASQEYPIAGQELRDARKTWWSVSALIC